MSRTCLKGKTIVLLAAAVSIMLVSVSLLALNQLPTVNAPTTEIIVDNPAASFTGTWPSSTLVSGYYGSNYQYHAAGTGANTAYWSFNIPTVGHWQTYARWTADTNRATNAKYTVYHSDGSTVVTKNQQANGGSWQSLGTFIFGSGGSVRLTDDANGYVIADAIRLVWVPFRTRVNVSVPACAFVSPRSDDVVQYSWFGCYNRAGHVLDGVLAPLHLPHGATITNVFFYFTDKDVDYFQFYLVRAGATFAGNEGYANDLPGSNTPGSTYAKLANLVPLTVDNSKYAYLLSVRMPYSATPNNYYLSYAIVEYEVPP